MVLYIELAHQNLLPAVFEYYTGEWVRQNTESWFFEPKSKGKVGFFHFYDILDSLTRETGYLGARALLEEAQKIEQNLVYMAPLKEIIAWVSSDNSLITFLRKPKDRFAEVYQWDFVSRLQDYPLIDSFCIRDKNKKILYKSKNFDEKKTELLAKNELNSVGYLAEVRTEEGFLGTLEILWNKGFLAQMAFSNQAGYQSFFVKSDGTLIGPSNFPKEFGRLFLAKNGQNFYKGPYRGVYQDFRVVAGPVGEFYLVIYYKKAPWYYYLFYFLTLLTSVILAYLTYRYLSQVIVEWKKKQSKERQNWLELDLQKAFEINRTAIELAGESISEMKNLQSKTVELVSSIYQVIPKMPREVKVISPKVENQPQVLAPSPRILTNEEPENFSIEVIKELDLPLLESVVHEDSPSPKEEDLTEEMDLSHEDWGDVDEFLLEMDDLKEPNPVKVDEAQEIVDEFKENDKFPLQPFLQLRENLDTKGLEIVWENFMSIYPSEEDFILLSVDGPLVEEVMSLAKDKEKVELALTENILFEDEELENPSLDFGEMKKHKEKVFLEYHLPYEMVPLEVKKNPLILQEEFGLKKASIQVKKDEKI